MARRHFRSVLTKKYKMEWNIPELVQKLEALGAAVDGKRIIDALMVAAMTVRNEIRSRAPYDPKRKQGTHLRDAIFAGRGQPEKDPKGPSVLFGVNYKRAPHAHLLEYGTVKMSAKPYFRPGVTASRDAVAGHLAGGIQAVIAEATTPGYRSSAI